MGDSDLKTSSAVLRPKYSQSDGEQFMQFLKKERKACCGCAIFNIYSYASHKSFIQSAHGAFISYVFYKLMHFLEIKPETSKHLCSSKRKDHVTLKTNETGNSDLHNRKKLDFTIY